MQYLNADSRNDLTMNSGTGGGASDLNQFKGRKNSEGFRKQIEEMKKQHKELGLSKGGSSRKNKKNKVKQGTMDGVSVEVDLAKISAMHKTTVDKAGGNKASFPKLPGLVIKGQGDAYQPISLRSKAAKHQTAAFALSPKLVK